MRVYQRTFTASSKRKAPNLLREVGFGRRVRGSAKAVNKVLCILGGILLEKQNVSMILPHQFCDQSRRPKLINFLHGLLQNVIHHLLRDVHAGGRDAVAKFHRVIDLVDGESVIGFEKIEREQSAADGFRGAMT